MFDDKMLKEMAESVKKMGPKERKKRAESLQKLLDVEMNKRNIVNIAATKKKGRVFEWLSSLWKDDE